MNGPRRRREPLDGRGQLRQLRRDRPFRGLQPGDLAGDVVAVAPGDLEVALGGLADVRGGLQIVERRTTLQQGQKRRHGEADLGEQRLRAELAGVGRPADAHLGQAGGVLLLVGRLHRRQRRHVVGRQRLVDEAGAADGRHDVLQLDLRVVLAEEVRARAGEADPRSGAAGAQRADVVGLAGGVVGELAPVAVVADRGVGGHRLHRRREARMARLDLLVADERVPLDDEGRDRPVARSLLQGQQLRRRGRGTRGLAGTVVVHVRVRSRAVLLGPPTVRHGPSIGIRGRPRNARKGSRTDAWLSPARRPRAAPTRRPVHGGRRGRRPTAV